VRPTASTLTGVPRSRSALAAALGLLALLGAAGGAAGCRPGAPPTAGEAGAGAAASARSGAVTVELPGPPAGVYSTQGGGAPGNPFARRVLARRPGLEVDPCLERAAEAYAAVDPELVGELPMAFVEHLIHWAGCPDPSARLLSFTSSVDDTDDAVEYFAAALGEDDATTVGVARVEGDPPMRWRWVALAVRRRFELAPVPASAAPGGRLTLQLRVDPAFGSAKVVVTEPDGLVLEHRVGLSAGWAVATVPLSLEHGRQWVEVVAEGARGPEVLALFPVEVGREPRRSWVGELRADEGGISSADQAEALVAGLLARERERHGLRPLTRDRRLDEVARGYSEEMAANGVLAHVSTGSGAVQDRLAAADYPYRFAAENLAEGTSLWDAHEGLLRSPGHRAAILSTEVTRVGVGVARRGLPGDGATWFVTQVFVRPADPPDAFELRRAIESGLEARRAQRGLSTSLDPRLGELATRVAEEVSDGRWMDEALEDRISTEIRALGFGGAGWRTVYGQAWDADALALPTDLESEEVRAAAVGVAVPSAAGGERPATYVVLVVR